MLEVGGTKGRKGKGKMKEGQKKVKGKENGFRLYSCVKHTKFIYFN